MIKKYLPFFLGIISLFLVSCDNLAGGRHAVYEGPGGGRDNGKFYAQNVVKDNYYSLFADKLFSEVDDPSTKCVVWAERGCGVSFNDAKKIAKEYNDNIYPIMLETYGVTKNFYDIFRPYDSEVKATNTMEFADYYGDGDGKLCILLLNIKDGYEKGVVDSYVGGYFAPLDIYGYIPGNPATYFSNECDMVYIDVKVDKPNSDIGFKKICKTIAHEMQHLMNYVTSYDTRLKNNTIWLMERWINEGLSLAAEYVYSKEYDNSRISWYNTDHTGLIRKGNNFYVWDNHSPGIDGNPPVLDDYATAYLFFQWLRLQAGSGFGIYSDIIQSGENNFKAVVNAAVEHIGSYGYSDPDIDGWDYLLRNWLAANYCKASSGLYGYRGESIFNYLTDWMYPGGGSGNATVQLYPGEGIYSHSPEMPSPSEKIKYAGLAKGLDPNDTSLVGSTAMLSYNVDKETYGRPASAIISLGSVAGVPDAPPMGDSGADDSQSPPPPGPYPVDAGDMRKIHGHKKAHSPFTLPGYHGGRRILFND